MVSLLKKYLEKNINIKNIFTKTECNNYIKDIWKFLENLGTGIKKKDKKKAEGAASTLEVIIQSAEFGRWLDTQ